MTEAVGTETVGLVQQFVERTGQLYSLPAAAAEVLRLTSEPRIDPRALKECLESDPALAARILARRQQLAVRPQPPGHRPQPGPDPAGHSPAEDAGAGLQPAQGAVRRPGSRSPRPLLAADAGQSRRRPRAVPNGCGACPGDEAISRRPGARHRRPGPDPAAGPALSTAARATCRSHGGSLLARELDTLGFDHLVLSARLLAPLGTCRRACAPRSPSRPTRPASTS